MPINPNMRRWIFASISKFLDDNRGDNTLWLMGQEPINQTDLVDWAEFYMQGPSYSPLGRDYQQYDVDLLLAVVIKKDYQDAHRPQKLKGFWESVVSNEPINVYRFGNSSDDDKSYVGCLRLRDDVPRPIDGLDFGAIETDIRVERATVEAFYRMTIDA